MALSGVAYDIGSPLTGKIDVRNLTQRMNTGIGAPGALDHHRLAGERRDRLLHRLLNGEAVLLPLPADERLAVIFDGELVARHRQASRTSGVRQAAQEFAAATGCLPARCNCRSRTAPLAARDGELAVEQRRRALPRPSRTWSAATLMRSCALPRVTSNQAPGRAKGHECGCALRRPARLQSMRVSPLSILAA